MNLNQIKEILLKSSPLSIHYTNKYINFIEKFSLKEINGQYYEKHHILPVSTFPEFKKEAWNFSKLSARAHAIAHYLYALAFGGKHWISVNIIAKCENPYQQRKQFIKFNSVLYERARLEQSNVQSEITKKSRQDESKEITLSRVEKWHKWRLENPEVYNEGIIKGRRARISNLQSGKTTTKPLVYKKCEYCNREIIIGKRYDKHLELCLAKILKKEQSWCKTCNIRKTKNHICRSKPMPLGNYTCEKCNKLYTRYSNLIKHLDKCKGPKIKKNIKHKIPKPHMIKYICKYCGKKHNKESTLITHYTRDCRLSPEERFKIGRIKTKEKRLAKSETELKEIYKKQANSLKNTLSNMSEEERELRNRKSGAGIKKFYESEEYDSEERSRLVKEGIRAKNNKNRENSV